MLKHAVRNRWQQPSAQLVFQVAKGLRKFSRSQGLRGMNRLSGYGPLRKRNRTRRGAAWRQAAFAPRLPTTQLLVPPAISRIAEMQTLAAFEFVLGIEGGSVDGERES